MRVLIVVAESTRLNFEHGRVEDALTIMREAARWLIDRGQPLWQLKELTEKRMLRFVSKENFITGYLNEEPAAAMILQWTDRDVWPEIGANQSGFIHKLSVRRKYAGQGLPRQLIAHAEQQCLIEGVNWLRLDCDANRPELIRFYQENGFILVGRKTVSVYEVALFELNLADLGGI